MKLFIGAAAVLVLAALATAVPFFLPHAAWLAAAHIGSELCALMVVVGSLRAAFAFTRGDRMRAGWLWIAISGAVSFVTGLAGPPLRSLEQVAASSTAMTIVHALIDIVVNVTVIAGLFTFARAWSATGLAPPWQRTATLAAFVLGLAVAGPPLWHESVAMLGGSWETLGDAISSVGDIIAITLAGPLFASAVWMRGGALVGPFVYLTCATRSRG